MDLVAGVRKEGSRGGRDSFKWSDVKESSHRENYLGHSIMAPVGRWQRNRDLNWYAKSDESSADKAKQEREEEIRRIKEAEQDAMALALGLPVAPRASNNANMTPLGGQEVRKVVQESTEMNDKDSGGDGGRGIGFGSYGGAAGANEGEDDVLAPIGMDSDLRVSGKEKDGRDRGHRSRRDRSRDRDRRRDREHRDRGVRHRHDRDADRERHSRYHHDYREHRRHRSRSRSVSRSPRPERRDRRPDSDRRRDAGRAGRHRSSSPRRVRDHESGKDAHHRHHRR